MRAEDLRELRLRVQAAFSAPELRRVLESWGAGPAELDAPPGDLAHHLVKLGIQRFGAPEVVRRLTAEKPLVEWPDLEENGPQWARPPSNPTIVDGPPSFREPEPPLPPTIEPPAPAPAPSPTSAPAYRTVPSSGTSAPSGSRPRWIAAIAAVMVVLAGVAFAAGAAWRRPDPGAAAPVPSGAARDGATSGAPEIAGRAAGVLDDALLSVARLCDLEVTGAPSREVLAVAQEGCATKGRRPPARPDLAPERDREASPPPDPERTASGTAVPAAKAPQPTPPAGGRGSCSTACARVQDQCNAECGPEPRDASQYDTYQACASKCVAAGSRCRLSCP